MCVFAFSIVSEIVIVYYLFILFGETKFNIK